MILTMMERRNYSKSVLLKILLLLFSATLIVFLSHESGNNADGFQTQIVEIIVHKNDTLDGILRKQNLSNREVVQLIQLTKKMKASRLQINQKLLFTYDYHFNNNQKKINDLKRLDIVIDKIKSLQITKKHDKFIAEIVTKPIRKIVSQYEATINSSLIESLQNTGMNKQGITRLIKIYTHQIDFTRQIKTGDEITVIIEEFVTNDGQFYKNGEILYSSLSGKGKNYAIYMFPREDGEKIFLSENGQNIKGTLLATPVKAARISSKFGYRKKHPVLGYGRMHKGIDFAAPAGTPIYAAGDGTISFIGWKSGYGRFILIKHNKKLSTAYAHSSRFAKNLKRGSKVKQGQIIAYVGASGRVTGAHLHYEIRVNGKQVNPANFKSSSHPRLMDKEIKEFSKYKKGLMNLKTRLSKQNKLPVERITEIKL